MHIKKLITHDNIPSREEIALLIGQNPSLLEKFEEAYCSIIDEQEPSDNLFNVNSRQASADIRKNAPAVTPEQEALAVSIIDRATAELLAQTQVKAYGRDGTEQEVQLPASSYPEDALTVEDIEALPAAVRPQLTGNLITRDIQEPAYRILLHLYAGVLDKTMPPEVRQSLYHAFRQGLDIVDLDEITYRIIDRNRTSMGYWLPALASAVKKQTFFRIPETRVAKVPLPLLQLTRLAYETMTPATLQIVDKWAMEAFNLDESKDYFIKTGTYSSKFDFRNARVRGAKEVRELGEYLLYVHYQALQMASPLSKPCIYGTSTTTEWVVREFIEDKENNPCIYKGMPLHTEYRIFVDCDKDTVLAAHPYWDPEVMQIRFQKDADEGKIDGVHDIITYQAAEKTLMERYAANLDSVVQHITRMLPNLDLDGQWSIDVMQNGDEFWLIDMAPAESSAFYTDVPKELRRPAIEDWMPRLN